MSATLLQSAARRLHRVGDVLLTTQAAQRLRLAQAGLAMLLMSAGVLAMHYFVWAGAANAGAVWLLTAAVLGGMATFFGLIRSGWSRRCADPAMTFPQMVYALACGAAAYALLGAGRGGVFPMVMATLMFGMFQLQQRQAVWISVYAVLLFGGVMLTMASLNPQIYPPLVELGHFLLVAIMMPAVSILAGRLSQMRQRLRDQKRELSAALARIKELASQDELTGLPNRRQMLEVMEAERQRGERGGRPFCLAMLDIDHFKAINDAHGHGAGDTVLRELALTMRAVKRSSDVLGRWGGEEFLLLLNDTGLADAVGGVERLREHVQGARLAVTTPPLALTVSCGVAEHLAGETVAQTLERADQALYEAKARGRNCTVLAPDVRALDDAATAPTGAAPASSGPPVPPPAAPNPRSSPPEPPR